MRPLLAGLCLAALSFGQGIVNQTAAPPPDNYVQQFFYSGSNVIYECRAPALEPPVTFYVSSSTLTSIAVASNVGTVTFPATTFYGWVGMTITVAGSATTALNKTYVVSAVTPTTATIATSGVSDGTYNDTTLTVSSRSPLLNSAVWAIHAFKYDGSSNLIGSFWEGTPGTALPQGLACTNRTNY